ncbi:MAG TPA: GTA-gp10 family protein [Rhizomicrobium sp.]|jgi:hypothetical protein
MTNVTTAANTVRGDSTLVAGGQTLVMRLTLGALSEIEQGLASGGGLADIGDRLKSLASKDIAVVASALLKGGGFNISASDVMKLETDVGSLVGAITGAFTAATGASAPVTKVTGSSGPLAGTPSSNTASA